jgi:Flp pilus assembly protein TadG
MIRRHIQDRSKCGKPRRSGIATLEMAVMLILLVNICFGTVEFGYYFYMRNTCENAAREGCRASISAGATYAEITSAVDSSLTNAFANSNAGQTPSNFTIVVQDNGSTVTSLANAVTGDTITVTVSGTWSVVGAGFRPMSLISGTRTISGMAVMRKEG